MINFLRRLFSGRPLTESAPTDEHKEAEHASATVASAPDVRMEIMKLLAQGRMMKVQGDYGGAEPIYLAMFAMAQDNLEPNNPIYATCVGNLAQLYCDMGRPREAEPYYLKSLEIYRQSPMGTRQPQFATVLYSLAVIYQTTDRQSEAAQCYREVLDIERMTIGEMHPSFATTLGALAILYGQMQNYAAALPLYEELLKIKRATSGHDHPDTVPALTDLAEVFRALGNTAAAEQMELEALRIENLSA